MTTLPRTRALVGVLAVLTVGASGTVTAAQLQGRTVAAFERYVAETERQAEESLKPSAPFLRFESLADDRRRSVLDTLRNGDPVIQKLETRSAGKGIDIPGGLIHHWVGTVFVPGVTLAQAVTLLQDYDRHADVYEPMVARSQILSRTGNAFRVSLRFVMKKVITVVVNSDHEAVFTHQGSTRAHSRIVSTRIAEVENPDLPGEKEKPVGDDGGYLWRLHTYWRFLERDGGTYIQCESITLSRDIPFGLGWLIGPFVTSIPRESLTFTLTRTGETLLGQPRR